MVSEAFYLEIYLTRGKLNCLRSSSFALTLVWFTSLNDRVIRVDAWKADGREAYRRKPDQESCKGSDSRKPLPRPPFGETPDDEGNGQRREGEMDVASPLVADGEAAELSESAGVRATTH